jgi:hypothetical protein
VASGGNAGAVVGAATAEAFVLIFLTKANTNENDYQ